jgi:DNA recombination protein RmuC
VGRGAAWRLARRDPGARVWLPVDSKLPQQDHIGIQDAADLGDVEVARQATQALARANRLEAQDIHRKYVKPPHITDFAIVFLATEGL